MLSRFRRLAPVRLPAANLTVETLEDRSVPATFTVSNLNDSGEGSLRNAIKAANAAVGADVVAFQTGLAGQITLTTGQIDINDSVDIQGIGKDILTVSGNDSSRVFNVFYSESLVNVTISGLTISHGSASGGAGIRNQGANLTLEGVRIASNSTSGDGAGLLAEGEGMTLKVNNSVVSGNSALGSGGGILVADYSQGSFTLSNSTISGNAAGDGGGLLVYGPSESLIVQNTTISGNTANGIVASGQRNEAHAAAEGGGRGGGVFLYNVGSATIVNTTIAGNSSTGTGGGIDNRSESQADLISSIVAGNTAASDSDIHGSFALTTTLVQNSGAAFISDNGGNLFGVDPQLGVLQDNGGPTPTHLPSATSPVLNVGSNPDSLAKDQRGYARQSGSGVDMGAVERDLIPPTGVLGNAPDVTTPDTFYNFTVVYSDDFALRVSSFSTGDIRVVGPNGFNAIAIGGLASPKFNGTPRTGFYELIPPGGSWTPAANGVYTIYLEPSQVADSDGNFAAPKVLGTFRVALPTPAPDDEFWIAMGPPGGGFPLRGPELPPPGSNPEEDGDTAFVKNLYLRILGRDADDDGLSKYVAQLKSGELSRQAVVDSLLGSDEYLIRAIHQMYRVFLDRQGDDDGVAGYLAYLKSGKNLEDVAASMLASDEYRSSHQTDESFVAGLYRDVLGRDATEEEQAAYAARLGSGESRYEIAFEVLRSDESDARVVKEFYHRILSREPDENGGPQYVSRLAGPAHPLSIGYDMLASDESFLIS